MTWAGQEFAGADLGDDRRVLRLMRMVERLAEQAEQSVPQVFGSWSETKAAYRFFENKQIEWRAILAPHRASTVRRAGEESVVLVAQDTTEINLTSYPRTSGLGYLASPACRGVLLHTCLAMTPAGVALGIIDQQMWTRPLEELGKRHTRKQKPTAAKESQRWLTGLQATAAALAEHPQVVVLGDRESDLYDLFALERPANMHLLVRVCREQRLVDHPRKYLREALAGEPLQGVLTVEVPRQAQRPPRQAELAVRWLPLAIRAPRAATGPLIPLRFVSVEETNPPRGVAPIRWLLATTLPVEELSQAVACVEYYVRRWVIERFHYTLKSGCLVEQRRFETVENVCRAVACFSIVAWRLLWLLAEARQQPDQPCTVVLSKPEWESLEAIAEQRYRRPRRGTPPPLGEAVQLIAKLGGHLGRKGDGLPGMKTLWRGLARLSDIATGWLLPRPP